MPDSRSALSITRSVWKALFLREAVSRLSVGRAAWVWILAEPLVHLAFLMTLQHVVFHRMTGGVDGAMFIATGLLGFFLVTSTASRSIEAVNSNSALFAYRQVLPVDTVIVRAMLEGFLTLLTASVLLVGATLFGLPILPANPLTVVLAALGLWFAGLGLGLMLSVARELIPEIGKIVTMLFRPLYFLSGIMYAALAVPQPFRDWLLYNPILHGLELIHAGFFAQFHAAPGVSMAYLWGFALVNVFFGLALHVRFARKMVTQ